MYKKNRIKEMIDNGQIPLGMQCFTGDPALIEIMDSPGLTNLLRRHGVTKVFGNPGSKELTPRTLPRHRRTKHE